MNELLKIFLSLSLSGTLLILILLWCKPLYKSKLSKQWQYYIWLIVIARLLLPLTPETSIVGAVCHHLDVVGIQTEVHPQLEQHKNALPQADFTPDRASDDVTANAPAGFITNEPREPEIKALRSAWLLALQNSWLVWLIVATALIIRKVTIYQGFVKYIKAGRVEIANVELWERFGELVEQSGVKGSVGIYTNSLISSPLLIGFFRPCIILPTTELSPSDFQYTILHELTHYKRRDMFYKWLVQLTVCLHWFNPFVYLMARDISRACELSCDEAVLQKLDRNSQRAYGDTLLNALETGGCYKNALASVTFTESKELLKERLDAIMNYKKKSRRVRLTAVLLTALLLCGFTFAGAYAGGNTRAAAYADTTGAQPAASILPEGGPQKVPLFGADHDEQAAATDFPPLSIDDYAAAFGTRLAEEITDRTLDFTFENIEKWAEWADNSKYFNGDNKNNESWRTLEYLYQDGYMVGVGVRFNNNANGILETVTSDGKEYKLSWTPDAAEYKNNETVRALVMKLIARQSGNPSLASRQAPYTVRTVDYNTDPQALLRQFYAEEALVEFMEMVRHCKGLPVIEALLPAAFEDREDLYFMLLAEQLPSSYDATAAEKIANEAAKEGNFIILSALERFIPAKQYQKFVHEALGTDHLDFS